MKFYKLIFLSFMTFLNVPTGFEKIELEPGESATVSITIPASDLAFVGMDGKWRLEEGISL